MIKKLHIFSSLCFCFSSLFAKTIFVSPNGQDKASGSKASPLKTIQRAINLAKAGDTVFLTEGRYHQRFRLVRSGTQQAKIKIIGQGPKTILDGTTPVPAVWKKHSKNIYKIKLQGPQIQQAFKDGKPLSPARWPNASFEDTWIRDKWAVASKGAKANLMVSKELANSDKDWTGATAVMNLAHQFKTWSRTIKSHKTGQDRFTYDLGEKLSTSYGRWDDDRFYITNSIYALDVPGEFFHDTKAGWLYLYTAQGQAPKAGEIQIKRRDFAITANKVQHIEISNLKIHASTIQLSHVNNIKISKVTNFFPASTINIPESLPKGQRGSTPCFGIIGNNNEINSCHVAYSTGSGITTLGRNNKVINCLVHDVAYSGNISFKGIGINKHGDDETSASLVSHCTVFNTGNIAIEHRGKKNIVEHNLVHHSGLTCLDIAAVHTGSPLCAGSIVRYNKIFKINGKAIRGDNQTRELTVHNNLVFSSLEGIVAKGDNNKVYNNTVIGKLEVRTRPEPKLWWTKWKVLKVQNMNSIYINNYVADLHYGNKKINNKDISHNIVFKKKEQEKELVSASKKDLSVGTVNAQLKQGSKLINKGRVIKGLTDKFSGSAPDIGAFEYGKKPWKAGSSLSPDLIPFFLNIDALGSQFDVTKPKEIIFLNYEK